MLIAVPERTRMRLAHWLTLLVLLPGTAFALQAELFGKALEAAREQQWDRLEQLGEQLGPDLPVRAYLDFHRLKSRLPELPAEQVRAFEQRHPDSPLGRDLRQQALMQYGEARRWAAIRALADRPPRSVALQCHFHRAWLERNREASVRAARRIWLSAHARPDACTGLFEALRTRGELDPELVWQRLLLAFRADNADLVTELARRLPAGFPAADTLRHWLRHPDYLRDQALPTSLAGERRMAFAAAVAHRLAYHDPVAARALVSGPRGAALGLQRDAVRRDLERRVVWFMTIRGLAAEREWQDQWLRRHGGGELIEQRARLAVREQDWQALPAWLARLDTDARHSARWQYWLGRARLKNGRAEAGNAALRRAAGQRTFYGFLAARRLDQPYALNREAPASGSTSPVSEDLLHRVRWLRAIGEYGLAVDEWRHGLYRADTTTHKAMARHALEQDWPALAVVAALHTGAHDVLDWRFPRAFSDSFRRTAERHGLEPWLLMAVARRESSFRPEARSPVGARGLMQLMPATARRTARQLGEPAPSPDELLQPETSIRLGGAHLAKLLERYDGHRLKALAAYNAGPRHVERWLPAEPLPLDVWIESITFRETRHYVQAVLAYRLIFALLHDDSARGRKVALLAPEEQGPVQPRPATTDPERQLSQR